MPIERGSLLLAASVILAGCAKAPPPQPSQVAHAGGTFRLAYQGAPESLDPLRILFLPDWTIASFVYEGLVGFGETAAELRPLLAESWTGSDSGKRWLFTLRDKVYFHDDPCFPGGQGRKVTSADVLYTFERIAKAAAQCENWYLLSGKIAGIDDFARGRAASIAGIRILDDRHIEFQLTKPYATFLNILASPTAFIVPKEGVEHYGTSFGMLPVGTGPFRLVRWKPVEQILFARNRRYWRNGAQGARLPYLESIDVRFQAESNDYARMTQFLKGESFLLEVQEKLYGNLKTGVLDARKFGVVGIIPTSGVRFLGFSLNAGSPFARHAELRRALALLLDRGQFVKRFADVNILLANTLVPPAFIGRTQDWYPYDVAQARAIVDRYRKEVDASTLTLASNFQAEELTLLQQSLSAVSVRSAIRIVPARYYQFIVGERPTLFRVSFVPSFFDPEDYYCLFYSKSSNDINLTGYRNPDFDRTLEAAMVEPVPGRRSALFRSLEEMLHRDVPAIYLSHGTPTYVVAAPHVQGARLRYLFPDLTEAWLAQNHEAAHQPEK